jgi:hypothetical protein
MSPIPVRRVLNVAGIAAIGVIGGFAAFRAAKLTGLALYLLAGGAAGAAVSIVFQWFRGSAQLSEVTISVPQFSELTFKVNNEARQVAWQLYVETVTRISTQSMADDDGLIREALTSLYGLFGTTRDTLKASRPSAPVPGGQTVEFLAVTMLNRELRPFLSKWHPRLKLFETANPAGHESAWPGNMPCRAELRDTQIRLLAYAIGFAKLAGVRDASEMIAPATPLIPAQAPLPQPPRATGRSA